MPRSAKANAEQGCRKNVLSRTLVLQLLKTALNSCWGVHNSYISDFISQAAISCQCELLSYVFALAMRIYLIKPNEFIPFILLHFVLIGKSRDPPQKNPNFFFIIDVYIKNERIFELYNICIWTVQSLCCWNRKTEMMLNPALCRTSITWYERRAQSHTNLTLSWASRIGLTRILLHATMDHCVRIIGENPSWYISRLGRTMTSRAFNDVRRFDETTKYYPGKKKRRQTTRTLDDPLDP